MWRASHSLALAGIAVSSFLLLSTSACRRNKTPVPPEAPAWLGPKVDEVAKQEDPALGRVGDLYFGVAPEEDDTIEWPVSLEAETCYLLAAAGDTTTVEEIYMVLYDPEDDDLESEKEDGGTNHFRVCTEQAGLHKILVKVTEGRGHVAVGVFAEGATPTGAAPQGADDLASRADAHAEEIAEGATRLEPHLTEADGGDLYREVTVGNCYWAVAAYDESATGFTLRMYWDADDRELDAADGVDGLAVVEYCAAETGMVHVQARSEVPGAFRLGLYERPATSAALRR